MASASNDRTASVRNRNCCGTYNRVKHLLAFAHEHRKPMR